MATVSISVTLKKQAVPVNPPASTTLRFQLLQNGSVVRQADMALPAVAASFQNVPDGIYTAAVHRLDNTISPIGNVASSEPFTVVNTTEIDVPDLVSVAI